MKCLVIFTLENGSTVLIKAEETEVEGKITRFSRPSASREIVNIINQTFEESLGIVKPVANTVLDRLKDLSKQPKKFEFLLVFQWICCKRS